MAMFDSTSHAKKCQGKPVLMLVPLKEKNPTSFQMHDQIDYCMDTNKLKDFYKQPILR